VRDVEPTRDFSDVQALAFEGERRGASRDLEAVDPGERVDDLFGDPVTEELVLRIGAHVHERKHCHAPPLFGAMTREVLVRRDGEAVVHDRVHGHGSLDVLEVELAETASDDFRKEDGAGR